MGIIGTNFIAEKFLKHAVLESSFKLNAIYSRTEERARDFSEKYGISNIFIDLEQMAISDKIDAVYIASPNSFHAEQAKLMLKHGKHVLCEKAVTSNKRELEEIIEIAKENNCVFMEAMITTMLPNFKSMQDNLHKLGAIRRYFASYCQYSSRYDAYKAGLKVNTFEPEFSNGSIMDIGVYCLHPLVKLFGEPLKIQANSLLLPSGVDGQGSIILTYKDLEGIIIHSKIGNSFLPSEIQGELGSMVIDRINMPQKIVIHYKDGSIEDISVEQKTEVMYYELHEFITLIENSKAESEINSHKQSMLVIKIIDEIRHQNGIIFPADK
jgi:predicted dehydrogenase